MLKLEKGGANSLKFGVDGAGSQEYGRLANILRVASTFFNISKWLKFGIVIN